MKLLTTQLFIGMIKLHERFNDLTLQEFFQGLFPRDNPRNTRFAINFFTSIGLGPLTEELREHLKLAPKLMPPVALDEEEAKPEETKKKSKKKSKKSKKSKKHRKRRASSSSSSSSSESSSESSNSDSDSAESDRPPKKVDSDEEETRLRAELKKLQDEEKEAQMRKKLVEKLGKLDAKRHYDGSSDSDTDRKRSHKNQRPVCFF